MITSTQNKSYKLWQKLKLKKHRDAHGLFLVYGPHLVEKAQEKEAIVDILTTRAEIQGTLISQELMDGLNQTETGFDVMAVCRKTNPPLTSTRVLMLDDVQDPDNVGALVRSAAAFGFRHVIFSLQTADLYNEKVIRASKGAIFDVHVERRLLDEAIQSFKQQGYAMVCTDTKGQTLTTLEGPLVLVLGNEGHGIQPAIMALADHIIHIPVSHVDSLNVAVAGGILMHQWRCV
ncbi:MAG: RNA methyltransferase [Acholeplasmataceae bacterium]|nr:MAG: RNA methyltransferase [Acholeplasmataceae bacterium]